MIIRFRHWTALAASLLALTLMVGCSEPERRKVSTHEEQQESQVQESSPGEMIVE